MPVEERWSFYLTKLVYLVLPARYLEFVQSCLVNQANQFLYGFLFL